MCSFLRPATLQFEMKLQKCIRMGITIFKIFIGGGLSVIRSEIMFYGSAWQWWNASPSENFEYSYPLIVLLFWKSCSTRWFDHKKPFSSALGLLVERGQQLWGHKTKLLKWDKKLKNLRKYNFSNIKAIDSALMLSHTLLYKFHTGTQI